MATTRTRHYGAAAVVMAIFTIIALILLFGILLVLAGANRHNMIVNGVLNVGQFFAHPFEHMFATRSVKQDILVNWGIGAIVYLVVGGILARLARLV
jgi:hypothetical protein